MVCSRPLLVTRTMQVASGSSSKQWNKLIMVLRGCRESWWFLENNILIRKINDSHYLILLMLPSRTFAFFTLLTIFLFSAHSEPLEINRIYELSLNASETKVFEVTVPDALIDGADMHIQVTTTVPDPYQIPFVNVTNSTFMTMCYRQQPKFNGVCAVDSKQLQKGGPNWSVFIRCSRDCLIQFVVYFSIAIHLNVGDNLLLSSPKNVQETMEILLVIPDDAKLTQIAIQASIAIQYSGVGELEMYANVGGKDVAFPTENMTAFRGISLFRFGKGIILSQDQVHAGQYVAILLSLPANMTIQIKTVLQISDSVTSIVLYGQYDDFCASGNTKKYVLNVTDRIQKLVGQSVLISVKVYSGSPSVQVSFREDFNAPLSGGNMKGNFDYLITESFRKELNFTGVIYLLVNAKTDTDYTIASKLQNDRFSYLWSAEGEYCSLAEKETHSYFHELIYFQNKSIAEQDSRFETFVTRIKFYSGSIKLGIARCKPYEATYQLESCLINSCSDLQKYTFQPIEVKEDQKPESLYYLSFEYDLTNCTKTDSQESYNQFYCVFQILVCNVLPKEAIFQITFSQRSKAIDLQEGSPVQDLLPKDEYTYYHYSLKSLTGIDSLTFFVTTVQGKVIMLVSNKQPYPILNEKTLRADDPSINTTRDNMFLFRQGQLQNHYYLGVYGLEEAGFSLVVIIERTNANKSIAQTLLHEGVVQEYTLTGNSAVDFQIAVTSGLNYTISTTELSGTVSLKLMDSTQKEVRCSLDESSRTACVFTAVTEHYIAEIAKTSQSQSHFIISYTKQDQCKLYVLNKPLLVDLSPNGKGCSKYILRKADDLQIATSLTTLQLISQDVSVSYCLGRNCRNLTSQHVGLASADLLASCGSTSIASNQFTTVCQLTLSYLATLKSATFNILVEESDSPKALFDGMVERVTLPSSQTPSFKRFYFKVADNKAGLKVFIYEKSYTSLNIYAHFVETDAPASNFYLTNEVAAQDASNTYVYNVFDHQMKVLRFLGSQVSANCHNCYFTLSIYSSSLFFETDFEIEATQVESTLSLGETKSNILSEGQTYFYFFSITSMSLLKIRDLNKQSSKQNSCFTASIVLLSSKQAPIKDMNDSFEFLDAEMFADYELTVESSSDSCRFQISLMEIDRPVIEVVRNEVYEANLPDGVSYYLYTHSSNNSFMIVEYLISGSSEIYATPIQNTTLLALMRSNLSRYSYTNLQLDEKFVISNTSGAFCWDCSYLIAVQASPSVKCELAVMLVDDPILLRVTGNVKSFLDSTPSRPQTDRYLFNSLSTFNLTIVAFYGSLTLTVRLPNGTLLKYNVSSSSSSLNIVVRDRSASQSQSVTGDALFFINATSTSATRYFIKVARHNITLRVFQGLPAQLYLSGGDTKVIEFLSVQKGATPITVLIQIIGCDQAIGDCSSSQLKFDPILESDGQAPETLSLSSSRMGASLNYRLSQYRGTYFISLTLPKWAILMIVVFRDEMIQLLPWNTLMMTHSATFGLYSGSESAFIQIQSCQGQITLYASNNFGDLTDPLNARNSNKEIMLQQANYGGHYLITVENQQGDYFVRVNNTENILGLQYTIRYSSYPPNELPPYKIVKLIATEITYVISLNLPVFLLSPIKIAAGLQDHVGSILYTLYVGTDKSSISRSSKCGFNDAFSIKQQKNASSTEIIRLELTEEVIGMVLQKQQVYFVGARAVVMFHSTKVQSQNNNVELSYETLQMSNRQSSAPPDQSSAVKQLLLGYVLPGVIMALIGLAGLLFFVRRYYKARVEFGELVEQDVVSEDVKQMHKIGVQKKEIIAN